MIQVRFKNTLAQEIVYKAVIRSFTRSQVSLTSGSILFSDELRKEDTQQKVVVFGKKPDSSFQTLAGIDLDASPSPRIHFSGHALTQNLHLKERFFERFDFTNEWNNLGYGRIERDPSHLFGIGENTSSYSGVRDESRQSVLWFNRNVGPVDGFDWRIAEDFISGYRFGELECLPVLSEIPEGYQGAVTMRIDCDEDILSGRPLFELYRKNNFPFSMAIKTDQKIDSETIEFMKEVIENGGAILTHSHTHACDWGSSPEKPGPASQGPKWEAETSLGILKTALPDYPIQYAVSPFHQNPAVAVQGIQKGGIDAFVGGIIHNDPEYLLARAGEVPFAEGIISHSQQCMLHGDCYHNADSSIGQYEQAFQSALKTETFFGFLDHPFSSYQYGWNTEEERLGVHQSYLDSIGFSEKLWRASLEDALDFLRDRALTLIHGRKSKDGNEFILEPPSTRRSRKNMKVRYGPISPN